MHVAEGSPIDYNFNFYRYDTAEFPSLKRFINRFKSTHSVVSGGEFESPRIQHFIFG